MAYTPLKIQHLNQVQYGSIAAVLSFFWALVRNLETRVREGDQAGFDKHLKTTN